MIKVGDVAWVQPGEDRAYVGRVVELSVTAIVLEDAVQIHDHGSWQRFHAGEMEGDGQRAHVSANPKGSLMTLPALVCRTMRWDHDLEMLRAWGDQ